MFVVSQIQTLTVLATRQPHYNMPCFEISILGGTGGPFEASTQCFMIRDARRRDLASICIDGGVGLGAIARMLRQPAHPGATESLYANELEPIQRYIDPALTASGAATQGFSDRLMMHVPAAPIVQQALIIFQGIGEYYITHPHMDHIAGMVVNSAAVFEPRAPSKKLIRGLPFTTTPLQEHVFNDVIWPQLTHPLLGSLSFSPMQHSEPSASPALPQFDITPFEVHHGARVADPNDTVSSTVYVITDRLTKDTIVVCGDLEKDPEDGPDGQLAAVWRHLAQNVELPRLRALLIECSNSKAIDETRLFGHLSSIRLVGELEALRAAYGVDSLDSLTVLVSHVKMVYADEDPRLTIIDELRQLAAAKSGLERVSFSIALQGCTFML